MDILTFWLILSVGVAIGWFIAVLMTGTKIQDLEDENLMLKAVNNALQEEVDSRGISNRGRVKK